MRARHLNRWTGCLVMLVVATAGTACGTGRPPAGPDDAEGVAAAPARRSADEETAKKAALAAYAGYLDASRAATSRSDPHHPDLAKFLADPLLTKVRLAIRTAREHGAIRIGTLVSDPTVVAVDLTATPPAVEIQDCLDATRYQLVYAADRKVVPGTSGSRHLATATATRYPDGRWLISTGAAHEDQPC